MFECLFIRRPILLFAAALTSLMMCHGVWAEDAPRPNILLIMVDDLGLEGVGCYGGESFATPNIDALATGGTRFTHCYATPICTPTRAQILTGMYPYRTGVTHLRQHLDYSKPIVDPDTQPMLGQVLKSAGYATVIVGKWQLAIMDRDVDHLSDCGFDEYHLWVRVPRKGKRVARYWKPNILCNGELVETTMEDYGPDMHADYLVDFMRRHKDGPFFAYYSMTLPHGPFQPPPGTDGDKNGHDVKHVGAMSRYMDAQVGRLIAELEALGIREQTLVIFTSDNGSPGSVVSVRDGESVTGGKRTLTDRGIRVPTIVNQPGVVPAGRVYEGLTDFTDILPTLAEVAGATLPQDKPAVDGRSFASQLVGGDGPTRDWVFGQLGTDRCLRTKRWKLMSDGRLFDMDADPNEVSPIRVEQATGEAAQAVARLKPILDAMQ